MPATATPAALVEVSPGRRQPGATGAWVVKSMIDPLGSLHRP